MWRECASFLLCQVFMFKTISYLFTGYSRIMKYVTEQETINIMPSRGRFVLYPKMKKKTTKKKHSELEGMLYMRTVTNHIEMQ